MLSRLLGSMMCDMGIVMCQADSKSKKGKLRLLYEVRTLSDSGLAYRHCLQAQHWVRRQSQARPCKPLLQQPALFHSVGIGSLGPQKGTADFRMLRCAQCFPMAYLVEHGGGRAIAACGQPVLDLQPQQIHERSPIFLGSKADVDRVEAVLGEGA